MTPDDWNVAGTWAGIFVTLGIAIVGWSQAIRSERRAKAADTRALEALELARAAEARADRLERIAVEKRDVHWRRWTVPDYSPYTLSFQNAGTDPALNVTLVVDSTDQRFVRQTQTFDRIDPSDRIGINLTAAAREAAHQVRTLRDAMGLEPRITVNARVTWNYESGVGDVWHADGLTLGELPLGQLRMGKPDS